MSVEQQVRDLLGPADPARAAVVVAPRRPAHALMAEAGSGGSWHPSRRLVLATAVLAVASGAVVVATRNRHESTSDAPILVPISYEFATDPQSAAPHLKGLAARLSDAPYEHHTGQYAYHDERLWGDPMLSDADSRYYVAYAERIRTWLKADGSGRQITSDIVAQYPDAQSRSYWADRLSAPPFGDGATDLPASGLPPLPHDRAGLAALLRVGAGAVAVPKELATAYSRYAIPKAVRADILRIVADLDGFVWRGAVTDRIGRPGVAITLDDREHDQQSLVIFHPETGELLAHELTSSLPPIRVGAYKLIAATDRVDSL